MSTFDDLIGYNSADTALRQQLPLTLQDAKQQYAQMLSDPFYFGSREGDPYWTAGGSTDSSQPKETLRRMIEAMERYGVDRLADVPYQVRATIPGATPETHYSSFEDSFLPGLIAIGGAYLGASGFESAGAGAAAGSGSAAGLTAAEEATMLGAASTSGGAATGAAGGAYAGLTASEEAAMLGAGDIGTGVGASGALGASSSSGATSGGMQPGVGEYGELGTAGWEGDVPGGPGVLDGAGNLNYSRLLQQMMGGGGGGSGSGGFGSTLMNAAPAALAIAMANSQRKDIDPFLAELSALSAQYRGNQPAYLKSLTDPYDLAAGQRRAAMLQDQGLRNVRGSSFGNQSIDNLDYMTGVGRGNILAQGINQGAQTQSGLIGQQIQAVNNRNLSSNALIGAGLGASARLFSPTPNPFSDLFGLSNLWQGQ